MEIDEIVDYATKSPENTNPAVLRSMLSQLSGGSGSGVFVVTFTGSDLYNLTADKSLQEILQASATQIVMGRLMSGRVILNSVLESAFTLPSGDGGAGFTFWSVGGNGGQSGTAIRLLLDASGTVTVKEYAWTVQDNS